MVTRPRWAAMRRGRTALGCTVLLILIGVAVYVGVSFGRVYFRYFRYRDDMVQTARFASQLSDEDIRVRLAATADSLGLPPDARSVHIVRVGKEIVISAQYAEVVRLPMLVRQLHFVPSARAIF